MKAVKGFPAGIATTGSKTSRLQILAQSLIVGLNLKKCPTLHEHSCTPCSTSRNEHYIGRTYFTPFLCSSPAHHKHHQSKRCLTQCGLTCIVNPSHRKSQLENGLLCAAAAWSTSSCLAASAREMSQGQLQMSCWVTLCHPLPAESSLSRHQEHLWVGKAHSPWLRAERCSTAGSWGHIPGAGEGKMGRAGNPHRNEPSLGSCCLARLLQTKWHWEIPCPHLLSIQWVFVILAHAN